MSIEQTLERIATALETLAQRPAATPAPAAEPPAAARTRKPKDPPPPEPAAAPPADDPFGDEPDTDRPELTEEDVRKAMVALRKKVGNDPALKLFKKVGGVETLKALPKEKYAAVYDAAIEAAKD